MTADANASIPIIVVESGFSGEIWSYGASGIKGLRVCGGCEYSEDRYTFRFADIQSIHHRIGDWIMTLNRLTGSHFRFLRKEIGLTADDFFAHGTDREAIEAFESSDLLIDPEVDGLIRDEYRAWRRYS